jgi:tRNA G18 (ribose-2'-O)-methylase SpoU
MRKNKNNPDLVVILDNIRSTYNVGAIFRIADATGVLKIYLCGITPIATQS